VTQNKKFKKLVRAQAKAEGIPYTAMRARQLPIPSPVPSCVPSVELRREPLEGPHPELYFRPVPQGPSDTCEWADEVLGTLAPIEREVRANHPELYEDYGRWVRLFRRTLASARTPPRSLPADHGGWRRVGLREARLAVYEVLVQSLESVGWSYVLPWDVEPRLESEETLDEALKTALAGALYHLTGAQEAAAEPFVQRALEAARTLALEDCAAALRKADAAIVALGWRPEPLTMPRALFAHAEPPDVSHELLFGEPPSRKVVLEVRRNYRVLRTGPEQLNVGRPCSLVAFGLEQERFAWVRWLDNRRAGTVSPYELEALEETWPAPVAP
jgi:hypothetical protein